MPLALFSSERILKWEMTGVDMCFRFWLRWGEYLGGEKVKKSRDMIGGCCSR